MKKWMQWTMTAMFAFALSAGVAEAGPKGVRSRQATQQKRIGHGVNNGELTKGETLRLQRNAGRIHRSIRRDRVDQGVFTPRERVKAQQKLNRQSRQIAKQKHDRQQR